MKARDTTSAFSSNNSIKCALMENNNVGVILNY